MRVMARNDTRQRDRFIWIILCFVCGKGKEIKVNKPFAGLQSYISE
jgi:hypothetical protein